MGFDQSQHESGYAEALPGAQVGRCTRGEPSVPSPAASRTFSALAWSTPSSPFPRAGRWVPQAPWPTRRSTGRRNKARRGDLGRWLTHMNPWQSILLAFGGNAVLLLVLGWLARSFGSQLLAKDLEKFKASLASASSEASERLKHELQMVSLEHEVRFSKLHERRAEVITSLYTLLVEVQWAVQSLVAMAEFGGEPPKQEKYVTAMNKSAEFFREFDKNRIFLPEHVCQQIEEFHRGMRTRVIQFGVYSQTNEYAPEHVVKEKLDIWVNASAYFDEEVPIARRALEAELRNMLAGIPQSVSPRSPRRMR